MSTRTSRERAPYLPKAADLKDEPLEGSQDEPLEGSQLPWLLRSWRDRVAGVDRAQAAALVNRESGTIWAWESDNDRRCPKLGLIQRLDQGYGADGALAELALAIDTPASPLPPRRSWAHNFPGPSGPVWAWLRPSPGGNRIQATVTWGLLVATIDDPCDQMGLFVTAPVSVSNPAVQVVLECPGSVDFGTGEIPEALGPPVIDGIVRLGLIQDRAYAHEFVRRLVTAGKRLQRPIPGGLRGFGKVVVVAHRRIAASRNGPSEREDLTAREPPVALAGQGCFSGGQFAALREARAMSGKARRIAAERASELEPPTWFTVEQLRGLEEERQPRGVDYPRARLDTIYRADGFTCSERVDPVVERNSATANAAIRYSVVFPEFWVGPVWITFEADDGAIGDVELNWPPWRKPLTLRSGTTVSTRRAVSTSEPLRVDVPRTWSIEAGMGMHPGAIDVSDGWSPGGAEEDSTLWGYSPLYDAVARAWARRAGRARD